MIFRVLGALTVLVCLIGCGGDTTTESGGPLKVVATTGMIADAVENIGGEHVQVNGLMGPGVDPHLYKATKGDVDLLGDADVVFYNGLNLEAKMAEILKRMAAGGMTTVALGERVDQNRLQFPEDYEGHPDPHIWFDLSLWANAISGIAETLAEADSANAESYRANGQGYIDSVLTLHAWVAEQIAAIPEERRVLVTAHDAFGYFGAAYGIEVRGLQGISTVTEAGLYDVTAMIDMLVEREIPAVFVESSVPRKAIEAVVAGCRDQGHDVLIGGELFSDAMGAAGTPEGTYFGMVRHNVNTIVDALK